MEGDVCVQKMDRDLGRKGGNLTYVAEEVRDENTPVQGAAFCYLPQMNSPSLRTDHMDVERGDPSACLHL